MIAGYRDRKDGAFPLSEEAIRLRFDGGLPANLTAEEFDLLGVDPVEAVDQPAYVEGKTVREGEPKKVGGIWRQTWIVEDLPAPPPTVPASVTMRQARLALLSAGILDAAETAIAAMPGTQGRAAQIEWEYATELRRDHPLVAGLGQGLGLDDAAIDQLFVQAAQIA